MNLAIINDERDREGEGGRAKERERKSTSSRSAPERERVHPIVGTRHAPTQDTHLCSWGCHLLGRGQLDHQSLLLLVPRVITGAEWVQVFLIGGDNLVLLLVLGAVESDYLLWGGLLALSLSCVGRLFPTTAGAVEKFH
jgi:hypothetical protein